LQLQHPVLDALEGGEHGWIKTLLFAFNAGDIGKFESLVPQFQTEVRPVLVICRHSQQLLTAVISISSRFYKRTRRSFVRRSA
jgi:hypothetical protein